MKPGSIKIDTADLVEIIERADVLLEQSIALNGKLNAILASSFMAGERACYDRIDACEEVDDYLKHRLH